MKHYFKSNLFPFLTLLVIALLVSLVYWGITYNSAAFKLAEKFNQAPEIKNSYQLDKLSLIQPAKDENSVEVKLGEANTKEFVPNLEINKWDGETKFKLKPDVSQIPADQKKVTMDGDKINYETPNITYQYYNKPDASEDGGYEFSEILKVKPDTNVFTTPIETENLDFFYQPALNQEIKIGEQGVVSCTETQCFDKDGNVIIECPENVVGSYAVYYKDNKSGDYSQMGGKNYQTGKAFHIFRPQVIDANGNKIWADLKIDTEKNTMSVTVPQDFLDKAVYPVIVDPTIGFSSSGASTDVHDSGYLFASSRSQATGGDGVASKVTLIGYVGAGFNRTLKMGFYTDSSSLPTSRVGADNTGVTPANTTEGLMDSGAITGDITNNSYYWPAFIVVGGTTGNLTYKWDALTDGTKYGFPHTEIFTPFSGGWVVSRKVSVYVTYTPSAVCGDGTCNGSETHATCPADCPLTANSENSTQINSPLSGRFLDSSLKGYWSFDGADTNWTSATAGTTNDLSGNSNTGTLTNMSRSTSPVAGINGQGLKFDGADDYVAIPSILNRDNLTISAWVKPGSVAGSHIIWEGQSGGNGGGTEQEMHLSIGHETGSGAGTFSNDGFRFYWGDSTNYGFIGDSIELDYTNSLKIGTWYHLVVTLSGANSAVMYVNGANVSSDTTGASISRSSWSQHYIGRPSASERYFNGTIDDVRVYNRVLSPSEITEQYNAGAAKMKINTPAATPAGLSSGLVGYWSFNGPDTTWSSATAGTTADLSGNNNTGTLTNMSRTTSPTPGISGQGLKFDGVDDSVNAGSAASVDNIFASSGTISAWIYPTGWGVSNLGRIISKSQNSSVLSGWYWAVNNNTAAPKLALRFGQAFGSGQYGIWHTPANSIVLNNWYHIVLTYNSSSYLNNPVIYINGILQSLTKFQTPANSYISDAAVNMTIGNNASPDRAFDGRIDEVHVYNRALSASEVQELYQQGQRRVKIKAD